MTNINEAEAVAKIKEAIRTFPNFPKPGIDFQDMMGLLEQPTVHRLLINIFSERIHQSHCDIIVGLESRGFLIGSPCALQLGLPFVPVRKKGKLPGDVYRVTYALEYGEDCFEMQKSVMKPGQRVVIVDDLLATGGTMAAACQLVQQSGATIVQTIVLTTLTGLNGQAKLPANVPFHTFIES